MSVILSAKFVGATPESRWVLPSLDPSTLPPTSVSWRRLWLDRCILLTRESLVASWEYCFWRPMSTRWRYVVEESRVCLTSLLIQANVSTIKANWTGPDNHYIFL